MQSINSVAVKQFDKNVHCIVLFIEFASKINEIIQAYLKNLLIPFDRNFFL